MRQDTGRTHQAYIWIFSLILEEETQVSRGLVTELMLPVFIHMAFSKNVRLSPTPPPFRVGRCTLPTLFSKKQPFRGNNVATQHPVFFTTLKKGARGRKGCCYHQRYKATDTCVEKGCQYIVATIVPSTVWKHGFFKARFLPYAVALVPSAAPSTG